ncbi:hypothetical protein, partial [Candidatus Cyanaurora vandensis]
MASTYRLIFDGTAAPADFYADLALLEVEENADLPGAVQLTLPVSRSAQGDLTQVSEGRFRPLARVAVVARAADQADECIFDGYILAHKLHLQTGITASTLTVWGQDSSWLMNLTEKTREWVDVTDSAVANTLFGEYGISASPDNTQEDSPTHTEDTQTLMQRDSDIQFLRQLARRNGKLCRVVCRDQPGQYIGYFSSPALDGDPVATLTLNDPAAWTVAALDFEWDVARPSAVQASQLVFSDTDPVQADLAESGFSLLDERSLTDFAGKPMTVRLTTAVGDAGELRLRAQSLLREASWFVRCTGEAEVGRLNIVLRVGTVV